MPEFIIAQTLLINLNYLTIKKLKISYLLIICVLCSCNYIKKRLIGIKTPEVENFESLKEYMETYHFNPSDLYAPADSIYWRKYMGIGLPRALFFNKKGHQIKYEGCGGYITTFLDSLNNKESVNMYSIDSIDNIFSKYQSEIIQLESMTELTFDSAFDYTVIMTWSKWSGEWILNRYAKDWQESLKIVNATGLRIRPIYLSIDITEHTGLEADDLQIE